MKVEYKLSQRKRNCKTHIFSNFEIKMQTLYQVKII